MISMRAKRWPAVWAYTTVVVAALLAIGAGVFLAWAFVRSNDAEASYVAAEANLVQARAEREAAQAHYDERTRVERQAETARRLEELDREVEREEQARLDSLYAEMGFENVGSNVYFRWADSSEYSCGNWDCAGFAVVAVAGCPSGLYLEAAIVSGSTQVGWTNASFAALAPNGTAAGLFEMVSASGDSFSLTEVNCY